MFPERLTPGYRALFRGRFASERSRYEMLADCINAMVEQLGLGSIEGRYPDDDDLVDLLDLLTRGNRTLGRWLDWKGPLPTGAPPPPKPSRSP